MSQRARLVIVTSYVLGLASLIASLVARVVPAFIERAGVSSRGGLIVAAVLFLCTIASYFVDVSAPGRAPSSNLGSRV